jgi:broad specificity polyphosphatase/5'/3'-nucleotidase SurE
MNDGYVSVTPMHMDMTAHTLMDELNSWDWGEIEA